MAATNSVRAEELESERVGMGGFLRGWAVVCCVGGRWKRSIRACLSGVAGCATKCGSPGARCRRRVRTARVLVQCVGQFGWQTSGRVDLMKPQVKMGCRPYVVGASSYGFCSNQFRPKANVENLEHIASVLGKFGPAAAAGY